MRPGAWRGAALNVALLVASLAVSFVAAEWFVRRYLPEGGVVLRLDPRCHYALRPGSRKLFRHSRANGGGRVLVTVNSRALRGGELEEKPWRRVAVYGDSSIFGAFSPQGETFPARLGVHLTAALGRSVEVVNAGVEGYGPCQSLLRLEGDLPSLRPDVVIFTVFADNDFGDLLRNKLFALDQQGRLVEGEGVLGPEVVASFASADERTPIHLFRGVRRLLRGRTRASLAREEELPAKLARQIDKSVDLCRAEYEEVVRKDRLVTRLLEDHYDADLAFWPDSEAARFKVRLLRAVLARLARSVGEVRIPTLVMVVPSPIDACENYDIRVDRRRFPEYDERRLTREAGAAALAAGLPAVDLFTGFREAGADRLYFRSGEDHWNAAGEDLAARLVSEWLTGSGWIRPDARPL